MNSLSMSPWSDSNEFFTVFESIYQNQDLVDFDFELLVFAKNKLTIWLTRMQHNIEFSVNIMATKEIITALIEDQNITKSDEEFWDESAVYSLYALSVIRFCTAISQYSHEDNMKSVKRLAHRYSCPQWIIDCRHNLCHSSVNQPTIEELRTAAMVGLNWLRQYFWLKVIDGLNLKNDYNNRNYFDLIDEYLSLSNSNQNNNNKTKTKLKNEIIMGLRHSPNQFITALIQNLINANNCETNVDKTVVNYESLKVPKLYLRKFSKLFSIIVRHNSLSTVLKLMVNQFDCENPSKRHLAMSWFSTIIKSIESETKVSKFRNIFKSLTFNKVMPKIEWIRLIYSVVKRPNPKTSALILLIAPIVSDFISDEKIKILVNLSKQYSCHTLAEDTTIDDKKADKEFSVKTVDDLRSTTDRNNGPSFVTNGKNARNVINLLKLLLNIV